MIILLDSVVDSVCVCVMKRFPPVHLAHLDKSASSSTTSMELVVVEEVVLWSLYSFWIVFSCKNSKKRRKSC